MLEYIKGAVDSLTPTTAVIDTGALGYEVNISLTTYSALEGCKQAKLLLHEIIREDAWILYGFATAGERDLFRLLIGVSGVGAGTARVILSSLKPDELSQVIASGDHARLKHVKGIGAKTAQRIIVDLRDKINSPTDTLLIQPVAQSADYDEALAALLMLGFNRQQSQKALKAIFEADPATKVEVAIKKALAMM